MYVNPYSAYAKTCGDLTTIISWFNIVQKLAWIVIEIESSIGTLKKHF